LVYSGVTLKPNSALDRSVRPVTPVAEGQRARQSVPPVSASVRQACHAGSRLSLRAAIAFGVLAMLVGISCKPSARETITSRSSIPSPAPPPASAVAIATAPTDGVTPPVLIKKVQAEFPEELRKVKVTTPLFIYQILVDANGDVRDLHLLRASQKGEPYDTFDQAFRRAIVQWKYRPATQHGKVIAFPLVITCHISVM
jgi:hypothetical protein